MHRPSPHDGLLVDDRTPSVRRPQRSGLFGLLIAVSGVTGCIEDWKGSDADGDGYGVVDGDCWDKVEGPPGSGLSGADIHPGADDPWYDGVDSDCGGEDDFDPDGDGWVKEEAHIGQATLGIPGSGEDHQGAGDCINTPEEEAGITVDPLSTVDPGSLSAADFNPGAPDSWYDGVDHDCDGRDDYDADEDGDRSSTEGDGTDCADDDPIRAGTFDELCDPEGIDEDCDELVNGDDPSVDPDSSFPAYADIDEDGFGDDSTAIIVCDLPDGMVADNTDCDDTRNDVHPDADEVCDAADVDENCNGLSDDDDAPSLIAYADTDVAWADSDGDDYGAGDPINVCDPGDELALNDEDCDDTNENINPVATEICDGGVDNNCDSLADDLDPAVDLSTGTVFYADTDSDGFGDPLNDTTACAVPSGYSADNTDCDDTSGAVNPSATEVCNTIDDDCDTDIDDADSSVSYGSTDVWYADADSDGYGDSATTTQACSEPSGYVDPDVEPDVDCDDTNSAVNPGEAEICDASDTDEDCDGLSDDDDPGVLSGGYTTWYADSDNDGYGDASVSQDLCDVPSGYVADDQDCNDGDNAIHPGAQEVCDAADVDEDCDGDSDDDDSSVDITTYDTFYRDADTDSYGDAATTLDACDEPSGYVTDDQDCNDARSDVNPAAQEVCDGADVDEDCDGDSDDDDSSVDASGYSTFYLDADGDGYGISGTTLDACDEPSGYADVDEDCDDAVDTTYPGAPETCNDGVDADCDPTNCILESGDIEDASDVVWRGENVLDSFGFRVAIVPDVNSDGVPDLVTSAYLHDRTTASGATNSGAVYISSSLEDVQLDDGTVSTVSYTTRILGDEDADRLGTGLAGGDFNNDGVGDLVMGAVLADNGPGGSFSQSGRFYLFLGPISAGTLETRSGDEDVYTGSTTSDDNLGWASAVGDIDGDVYNDLAVSAPQCAESSTGATTTDAGAGVVHVLPGDTGTSWFDVSQSSSNGIEFLGDTTGDCAGLALVFIDSDGSGFDELVVGAPHSVSNSRGTVYITDATQSGTQLLSDELALKGWSNNQDVGTALAKSDVNGDGYADLLIGAPGVTSDDGMVYVMYGNATFGSTPASVLGTTTADASIAAPSGTQGQLGYSLAGTGDLDDDGTEDVVIGNWLDDTAGTNAGGAWIAHGPLSGTITLDSSTNVQLTGKNATEFAGVSVASGYDLNPDTTGATNPINDIVVGANTAKDSGAKKGSTYIIFGQGD